MTNADLFAHIPRLAKAQHLAVVSDFDGTLAPFATDRYAVIPNPLALDALQRLAGAPNTTTAILSGRDIDGLRRVCPLQDPVIFGGSHGAETALASAGSAQSILSAEAQEHLRAMEAAVRDIVARYPGADIELKPFQVVLHVRELSLSDAPAAHAALEEAAALAATLPPQFPFTMGKSVAEFSATTATKGTWITQLRQRVGADSVVFVGDDVTDEHGFAALDQQALDLGIKVGPGETTAAARAQSIDEVALWLSELAAARQ